MAEGYYAALLALLPDVEVHRRTGSRTPVGHSIAYGLLWVLLALSALTLATLAGLLPPDSFVPLFAAGLIGLTSHLFLDGLTEPGMLTWRRRDVGWGRIALLGRPWTSRLNLAVSGLSVGTILALMAIY